MSEIVQNTCYQRDEIQGKARHQFWTQIHKKSLIAFTNWYFIIQQFRNRYVFALQLQVFSTSTKTACMSRIFSGWRSKFVHQNLHDRTIRLLLERWLRSTHFARLMRGIRNRLKQSNPHLDRKISCGICFMYILVCL